MKNPYGVNKARGREIVAERKAELAKCNEAAPLPKRLGLVSGTFRILAITRDTDLGRIEIGAAEMQPGDYIDVEEAP